MYLRNQRHRRNQSFIVDNLITGHTLVIKLNSTNSILRGVPGSCGSIYRLEEVHFHIGRDGERLRGSEHSVNGAFYPMEVT